MVHANVTLYGYSYTRAFSFSSIRTWLHVIIYVGLSYYGLNYRWWIGEAAKKSGRGCRPEPCRKPEAATISVSATSGRSGTPFKRIDFAKLRPQNNGLTWRRSDFGPIAPCPSL
jgi:hypothetical protein